MICFFFLTSLYLDKNSSYVSPVYQTNCFPLHKSISVLKLEKYETADIDEIDLKNVISEIDDSNIKVIIKEEKIENLQNQIIPFCYSYDIIPQSNNDLSRLINVLIEHPNSAVSIQLMPTYYKNNELAEIDRIAQSLEVLTKGITEQGIGNISFALAEKHSDVYKYYSNHKSQGLFSYNLMV